MQLYVIPRRNGFVDAEDLKVRAERSAFEGDKPDSGVRWIRSYVVAEESGELGTFCVYEGDSPEAIRAHAIAAGLLGRRGRAGRRHGHRPPGPRSRRGLSLVRLRAFSLPSSSSPSSTRRSSRRRRSRASACSTVCARVAACG